MKIILPILLLVFSIFAQEVNIVEQLKQIESGNKDKAAAALSDFKRNNPSDPSVIFLDAVLTENGKDALNKYESVYKNHPNSNYADASLYRIFSYYYSLGIYNKAQEYLTALENKYPNSPYLKIADRNIPEEDLYVEKPAAEKTKEPVEIIESPKKVENAKFTVQAGAFLNLANAQKLKEDLESDGYTSELSTKEVGGSILNVVTAGRFESEQNAQKLITHLKNNYKLNGRIIPIE